MSVLHIALGVLIGSGLLIAILASILLLVAGFRKHWGWGVGILLTGGIGTILFTLCNWRLAWKPFLMGMLSTALACGSGVYLVTSTLGTDFSEEALQAFVLKNFEGSETLFDGEKIFEAEQDREDTTVESTTEKASVQEETPDAAAFVEEVNTTLEVAIGATTNEKEEFASLVGQPIREAKRKYGNATASYTSREGRVTVHTDIEVVSRDGETITAIRRLPPLMQ